MANRQGKGLKIWMTQSLIINLAGKTVNCRYTEKNKKKIFDSRTYAVRPLVQQSINAHLRPGYGSMHLPPLFYRHAEDRPQDEYTGEVHDGFSVQVCKLWKKKHFYEQATPETRKVACVWPLHWDRAVVLIPYINLLKFGLGGKQRQWQAMMYSWIHIEDTCRL
jgi:NAD dependent epimerase/dehydratase family enzyme